MAEQPAFVEVGGRDVRVTNPSKVYFPDAEGGPITKLDLVRYWVDVAQAALASGCRERPSVLHRFPDGVADDGFYQKRLPKGAPSWVEWTVITFPSGRTAEMPVMVDAAHLAWSATLGCLEVNPWPVRRGDVDHPDELRIDLDPGPEVPFDDVRRVALVARDVVSAFGLTGFAKTSGKRGIHVNARIEPRWRFTDVRRAGLALAREIERRVPDLATTAWWKEERHGVFIDYNQNARDRTVASAYSVRPTPDARVSAPLAWDEVATVEPERFTLRSVPARLRAIGDPGEGIDEHAGSLDALLALAEEQEAGGQHDAPWPPHFEKGDDEPPRVAPSRARKDARAAGTVPPPAPGKSSGPTGRRRTTAPLIEVARAATKDEALAGLDRWKTRHPSAAAHLTAPDVLIDSMRGRSTTWTRIRVNLRNVPAEERPGQEALEVDYDPWEGVSWSDQDQEGGSSPS